MKAETPVLFFCLACWVVTLVLVWQPPGFVFPHIMQDDVFYGLKVAQNIARGEGSTFDGINPTNGYNPLYILTLIPIYALIPDDINLAFHGVMTLQTIQMLAAMLILYALLRLHASRVVAFLPLLLWINPRFVLLWLNGMPSILIALIHLTIIYLALSRIPLYRPAKSPWADVLFGVLLGLAFLARVDAGFLILAVGLSMLVAALFGWGGLTLAEAVKRLVRMAIPVLLLAVPYLLYNWVTYEHLLPISGAIKLIPIEYDSLTFYREAFLRLLWPATYVVFLLCTVMSLKASVLVLTMSVLSVLVVLYLTRSRWTGYVKGLGWLKDMSFYFLFCLFHYVANSVLIPRSVFFSWYWIPETLVLCILCGCVFSILHGWAASRSASMGKWVTGTVYGLCILLALGVLYMRWSHPRHLYFSQLYKQAIWIKEHLPEDAVVATWDAGALGYFSERRVMNLDGLINSFEYLEYKREGRLKAFLDEKGCQYLSYIQLYQVPEVVAEFESLRDRLVEPVYRSSVILHDRFGYIPTVADDPKEATFTLWRYEKGGVEVPVGGQESPSP